MSSPEFGAASISNFSRPLSAGDTSTATQDSETVYRGPKDHTNMKFLYSGPQAQDWGIFQKLWFVGSLVDVAFWAPRQPSFGRKLLPLAGPCLTTGPGSKQLHSTAPATQLQCLDAEADGVAFFRKGSRRFHKS